MSVGRHRRPVGDVQAANVVFDNGAGASRIAGFVVEFDDVDPGRGVVVDRRPGAAVERDAVAA